MSFFWGINMKIKNNKGFAFIGAVLVLVLCCFLTLVISGDDIFWFYAYERDDLQGWRMPNGRYLSNILTFLMVRCLPVRFALFVPLLCLLIWLLCRGMQTGKKSAALTWCGLMLFCLMPANNWGQNVMWTTAFPVYTIPVITVLVFLRLFFGELQPEAPKRSKLLSVGMLFLGAVGALCVEHMTLFSCMLVLFVLIYSAVNKKMHIRAYQIAYAAATFAGAVVMFLNPNYYSIAKDSDTVGERIFAFDASDIFFQMYQYVIPRFAKTFPVMHVLIFAGFLILLLRADRSAWKPERKRYAKLTIACSAIYAFYSVFVNSCTNLVNLTPVMRVAALECALAFLYLVSVVYLAWVLLPRTGFVQGVVYIVSAFVTSAFFCVVNPVNARCFFPDFCFWMLFTLTLWGFVLQELPQIEQYGGRVMQVFGMSAMCMMCYINIVNKVSFETAMTYMQEQCDRGAKKVELIEQPYASFSPGDGLNRAMSRWAAMTPEQRENSDQMKAYMECLQEYYHLSFDNEKFGIRTISYFDYNM